jgi:DNA (cytosine-5)-methyltransferase 1
MMGRPRLLDLFCGAGGCAVGYYRAGFDVVGVDHEPQPRYPFRFVQADALEFVAAHGREYDVIHASPPCQGYSRTQRIWGNTYPDLLGQTRAALLATGRLWVIENVEEAPMGGVLLCGTMFGLRVLRHRRFESPALTLGPSGGCRHPRGNRCAKAGRPVRPGQFVSVAGNISGVKLAGKAMGIDWMVRRELVQAIPPAYTEWVGRQLLAALQR